MGKRNLHIFPPPKKKSNSGFMKPTYAFISVFRVFCLFVCFYFLLERSGSQNLVSDNHFHLIIGSVNL